MMMTKLSAAMPALASQNDLLDSTSGGVYWEWPRLQPSSVEFLDRSIEFISDRSRYLETIVVFICYTNFFLDNEAPVVIKRALGVLCEGNHELTSSINKSQVEKRVSGTGGDVVVPVAFEFLLICDIGPLHWPGKRQHNREVRKAIAVESGSCRGPNAVSGKPFTGRTTWVAHIDRPGVYLRATLV
jgi:hypothetical protein